MEEAKKKVKRKTPPGGSCVDTLGRLFQGDSASRMNTDLDAEDSRSSGEAAAPHVTAAGARGRHPKEHGGPPRGTPTTPIPWSPAAMRMEESSGIDEGSPAVSW